MNNAETTSASFLMNYKKPETTKHFHQNFSKGLKNLVVFVALTLEILAIFYAPSLSSQSLPDCTSFSGTAQPGLNCLFNGKPLCSEIPNAGYDIPASNILTSGIHRVSCYDLSDLSLCSQLTEIEQIASPKKNCVEDCNSSSFNNPEPENSLSVRGSTYAVHNRDCIRFSDSVADENSSFGSAIIASDSNSTSRKCNQLTTSSTPIPNSNCQALPCNLLSVNELISVNKRVNSDNIAKTYCNGDEDINGRTLKCYKFSKDQLPYVISGDSDSDETVKAKKMCIRNNCRPTCLSSYIAYTDVNGDGVIDSSPGSLDSDDTLNIFNQDSSGLTDYSDVYKNSINGGYDLAGSGLCQPVTCKQIIKRQFRCVTSSDGSAISGDNSQDIYRNQSCDLTGDGAICSSNYCYKTIDCNDVANSNESECKVSEDGTIGSFEDTMDSWFYRPKPMNKAMNGSTLRDMEDSLCYSKNQMKQAGWGEDARVTIDLGFTSFTINLGYFHTYLSPNKTRSPGFCGANRDGIRGSGYIFLCGTQLNLYREPASYTAYHKGYVKTTFIEGDATHKVIVCLRFKNSTRPDDVMSDSETCGSRECGISCAFGICKSQLCGFDVCKELTITDGAPDECEMNSSIFSSSPSKKCMSVVDSYLRLRIKKYEDKICSFLDVKGQLAYSDSFFANGSEKLADGVTCVSGTNSNGTCNGKNTADDKGLADRWRTISFGSDVHIPYIQNNQPSSNSAGYLDKNGQLFAEQDCIKTPLRIPPPNLYSVGTTDNSPKLFTPPMYISNVMTRRDGAISEAGENEVFGSTDFHYPEIEVSFGDTRQKLSLGLGYNGYELTNDLNLDPQSYATIETEVNAINYSAEVFVKKEFNSDDGNPIFCLYRKVQDVNGASLSPIRIQCVARGLPEIDNVIARTITPSIPAQKLIVYADPTNTFDSSKIVLRYLASFGTNNTNNNCSGDDICSAEIKLTNIDASVPTCNDSVTRDFLEGYKICAQREECTKLNIECIKNEIDMQSAKLLGQSTDSYLAVRKSCNEVLLPICNAKKGLVADASATVANQNPNNNSQDSKAYGWFNEICLVAGNNTASFDGSLKKVVAYDPTYIDKASKGKCIVSPSSPYLTDANSETNCDDGGKAPNCLCVESDEDIYTQGETSDNQKTIVRLQTRREAGLCIDMPKPQTCPAISYATTLNSDSTDLYYVSSSLGFSTYGSSQSEISEKVHISHRYRTLGENSGHAEFPLTIFGLNSVEGNCRGFWKNETSLSSPPTRSCLINSDGTAQWSESVSNSCVRYSCPIISTLGSNQVGNYPDNYKGDFNGFAKWPLYTKTNDFAETIFATDCIPGYKKYGSSAVTTNSLITSYSGGTNPSRVCNQLGIWQPVSNICVRITCPAVNPPTTPTSDSDWTKWYNSGGATFAQANASTSTTSYTSDAVQTGTCNNDLGFFQLGSPPTRSCDYLGNWSEVINKCTTRCDAISTLADASSSNNGYAYWSRLDIALGSEEIATASSCISGYVPYPYPPLKNSNGVAFTFSDSSPNYTTTIPLTVANDNRTPDTFPKRFCKSVTSEGTTSNFWYPASSICINSCPGYDDDSRVGVGATTHNTKNGSITIQWPRAELNSWIYASNAGISATPNFNGQDASYYSDQLRNNGYYMVARKCNSNGKWDTPIPQCVTNGGVITGSNAIYSNSVRTISGTSTSSGTINVGDTIDGSSGDTATSTTCSSGYYQKGKDSNTSLPISSYTCEYSDSSKKIDQTYFKYSSGDPCQVYCAAPTNGQDFGNGSEYNGSSSSYILAGGSLNLSCKSGYGHAFGSGSDSTCGTSVSDRSSSPPSITCQSNGTWSNISNDCAACRGCNSGSTQVSTTSQNFNSSGNCGNKGYSDTPSGFMSTASSNCNIFSVASSTCVGVSFLDSQRWSCSVSCGLGGRCARHTDLNISFTFQCIDGNWLFNNECSASSYPNCF